MYIVSLPIRRQQKGIKALIWYLKLTTSAHQTHHDKSEASEDKFKVCRYFFFPREDLQ